MFTLKQCLLIHYHYVEVELTFKAHHIINYYNIKI